MEDEVRRAFDALPKSKYWRRTSSRSHRREATPVRIIATLRHPSLPIEYQEEDMTAYRKYLPEDGI